ncbi:MAG: isopentenyl-diphosphate Delta-isomerase [Crocinitomicaceae bacterium]|nr:isopentenyl-diphosphate Delta-isomerase [Crocinitomicaceae bacterium]MBK8925055.1 isopentenyl-diphosphate Delta-isomerase [Crocinitomicaceae bacterium]
MNVILVDKHDKVTGEMEKMEAHEKGLLHRAFSIFIFNKQNDLLLHQRAMGKYHSEGLWTNTCCSHPLPDETVEEACHRRLKEEMGFDTPLKFLTKFIYRAELDKGLTEHELDHVYVGYYDGNIFPDKLEVADWKHVSLEQINQELNSIPEQYTAWFKIIFPTVYSHIRQ